MKKHILLNILWNITCLSLCYCLSFIIIDSIYMLFCKDAIDRWSISAYFAPFDSNCRWKKRFPRSLPTKKYKTYDYTPLPMSKMDDGEFKIFVRAIFEKLGYMTFAIHTEDNSVSFIAQKSIDSKYEKICVQCSKSGRPISTTSIQGIYLGKLHYKCETAMVVTDSKFTKKEIKLADKYGIILWNKKKLKELSKQMKHQFKTEKVKTYRIDTYDYEDEEDDDSLTYEEIDNFDILDE